MTKKSEIGSYGRQPAIDLFGGYFFIDELVKIPPPAEAAPR